MSLLLSSDFVLTQPADQANLPIIGYHNVANGGNLSATSAASGYPASNMGNASTFIRWKSTDDGDNDLVFTNSNEEEVDYFAVAGHNFGTTGVTFQLNGPSGNLVPPSVASDNNPLIFRFPRDAYDTLTLECVDNPSGLPLEASVIYVGRILQLQRKIYVGHTPINLGRQSNVVVGRSTSGNFLGRLVLSEKKITSIPISNITPAWYRAYFEPFVKSAIEYPFFFAWRPGSYPNETGYCWVKNDIVPSNQQSNGMMQVTMDLEGAI